MDHIEAAGHTVSGTRTDLLGNTLVLIAPSDSPPADAIPDLVRALDGGRLAMALVEAVPAGIYGKAALQSLGQWETVAPFVAQTDNARAALALVATGAAPLGIVYGSDALAEPRVQVVAQFPPDSHPPIRYPVAALSDTPATRAFLEFLRSDAARATFEAQGFTLLD